MNWIGKNYLRNQSLRSPFFRIEYVNFWDGQNADEIWFTDFLRSRGLLDSYPQCEFVFFSTLGDSKMLRRDIFRHLWDKKRKRFFYTGENVHYEYFKDYSDNWVGKRFIDLSLGFDKIDSEKYLRFPLWILEMFPASSTEKEIREICDRLSYQKIDDSRNRFCAMVSGTSTLFGTDSLDRRRLMVEALKPIENVDCAGRFLRNMDELQTVYHDDKAEFLKRYKFFICPENTSVEGYVTEKVFHSIGSGCIPIYYGSNNNPEPDVLNHDAILFWNPGGDNESLIRIVDELWNNPKLYKEFFEQPRLQPNAWEVVANYFDSLEKKLHEICSR